MSTKLRSACDKCHEAKVRCSGDVPCQSCLASRSLCFYSPSNPLGRPRGTKKQSRDGSRGNNSTWDRDDVANRDGTATSGDRGSSNKRTRTTNGDCNGLLSRNMNGHRGSTSDLPGSSGPAGDDLSFIPTHHRQNNITMPDVAGPNDFSSLADSNTRVSASLTWNDLIIDADGENCLDLLRTSYTLKGYPTTQNTIGDMLLNTNQQEHFRENSEACLPVSIPASAEDMSMTNVCEPMHPTESASSGASAINACTCLQKQAEVLSNPILSEIRASDGPSAGVWSMDKALSLAKHAMTAWQSLLTCPYCPYDDDQEVMLLMYMSIRGVTRYLQRLCPRYINGSNSAQSAQDEDRLQIGSFELEGHDRTVVLRVLYQITLQKVKCILHALHVIQNKKKRRLLEKTRNKPAGGDDYQASSNLFHIQQISHSLLMSLQALESSLYNYKDPGVLDSLSAHLQAPKDI